MARLRTAALAAALVACTLLSPAVSKRMLSAATPLEKVLTLLKGIQSEIQTDGEAEAANYKKFSCFCKDKTKSVSESILKGKDKIGTLSATIEDSTAQRTEKSTELAGRKTKQESLSSKLTETTARCAKETAEYAAKSADLTKALQSLVDAKTAIKSSDISAAHTANLVAVKQSLQKSFQLAEAMKVIDAGPKWGALTSFLQEGVDPSDPSYSFHSDPILEVLEKLHDDFTNEKAEADAEYAKAKQTCIDTQKDLSDQMLANKRAISELLVEIGGLTSLLAQSRSDLVHSQGTMKDEQLYMKDLTTLCEKRAGEWDQRTKLRGDELDAISQALTILEGDVTAAEGVNKRALVQLQSQRRMGAVSPESRTRPEEGSLSFLQGGLESGRQAGAASLARAGGRDREALTAEQRQQQLLGKALELLRVESGRLRSTSLASLAARAAADPFLKVKTLIQRLIERLLKEATSEATKKGFCDTDLSKALQDRTFRYEDAMKLNAELRSLEVKKQQLELEIGDLSKSKHNLEIYLDEATSDRKVEKEQNLGNIQTANDGLKAITEAIMILKTFYKEAAKATTLVQKASPVDEDNPGAGFDGAYRGKQQASKGIIGLLEVIKSDFSRTVRKTTKAEEEATATFVEFDRSSKADISGKDTKITLDSEDLKTTMSTIASKMRELQENMNLVDTALKEVEALKPMCIDSGMSYDERVAKREKEVEALRKAFCLLDDQGVETALCTTWGYATL